MKKLRAAMLAVMLGATAFVVPVVAAPAASAHGWVTDPPSRQDHCSTGNVSGCGPVQYEPQSVENVKGSMQCSGGLQGFESLDDESKAWPVTTIGTTTTFQWKLTANHATSTWEYFVDGELFASIDDGGARPPFDVSHTLTGLPTGHHKILARWNVADTPMAFYNCIDVFVSGDGGDPTEGDPTGDPAGDPTEGDPSGDPTEGDPTGDPAGDPTEGDPTGTQPVECDAADWAAGTIYTGGERVAHDGILYEAKWWTLGDTPSDADLWGPWRVVAPC